jgi:hypothetical protein
MMKPKRLLLVNVGISFMVAGASIRVKPYSYSWKAASPGQNLSLTFM